MDRLFNKKRRKSPKASHQPIAPGTDTSTALGSHGFQTEQTAHSEADGGNRIDPWITRQDRVEESWTSAPGIGSTGHEVKPTDEGIYNTRIEGSVSEETSRIAKRARRGSVLGNTATLLGITGGTTERFGPLKTTLGAIPAACANDKGAAAIGKKIECLLSRIVGLESHFNSRPSDVADQRRRDELRREFEHIRGQLYLLAEAPGLRVEEISGHLEHLEEIIFRYGMAQQTTIYNQECELIAPDDAAVLNIFRCARGAGFRHGDRKGCLKGTRRTVLDKIDFWAQNFDEPPVYWLNGLAGTGKTTITQTVAERAFADGQLGASFFCSRDFQDRSNLSFIFPTLSVQLARKYSNFRSLFVPLSRSDPEVAHESLYNQMCRLIVQPLKEADISTVIIIDALDECKDEEPASVILSVLGQFVSEIPKVKFFVTGRPESRIREGFRLPLLAKATEVFVLHEVEPGEVDDDIRAFLRQEFSRLTRRRCDLDDWPTQEQLNLLCTRASGLFIYAVATVKFVDKQSTNPRKQLELLLRSPTSSAREAKTKLRANTTLDSLYTSILQGAFGDDDDPDNDPKVRSVFGVMVLAADPLSPSAIAKILCLDVEDVFLCLSSAQSLLILHEDVNVPVRSSHKSFTDFIIDPARCTNQRFHISPPDHHPQLLINCLDLMHRALEKNMCELPDGVANSDIPDLKERVERNIDPVLQYACRSWSTHLVDRPVVRVARVSEIVSALYRFLEKKFLFWLETLSVLNAARNAVNALQITVGWLEETPTLELAIDCSHFVTGYFEIIRASSTHIYHSALILTPKMSVVRRLYRSHARPLVRVIHGIPTSWDPNIAATTCRFQIGVAVWSSCSRLIAVSARDKMIVDILDSATLQVLQRLRFLEEKSAFPRTLIFSPDSRVLTCSAWSKSLDLGAFLISWDLQTGGIISVIEWKEPTGSRTTNPFIAYSTNGRLVGVLYQYSSATIISIFDVVSGVYMHNAYHESRDDENLRAYNIWTHGDSLRFATAEPTAITIREVGFAPGTLCTEVEILSVPDNITHTVTIQPWAFDQLSFPQFLPASSRFALAHAEPMPKVLVWDARDSKTLLHANINSSPMMTFSSDGGFFAYPVRGSEIHIWKDSSTGYIHYGKLTHGTGQATPLLSPSGESIIAFNSSIGDSVIKLWHTKNLTTSLPGSPTRDPRRTRDFVLDYLPDRRLATVARQGDSEVIVIDLESGLPQLTIETSMEIYGLRVIGDTVVAIGREKIITWNLPGDFLPGARMDVEDSAQTINSVPSPDDAWNALTVASISLDFRYVALITQSSTGSQELHIYNTSTGRHLSSVSVGGESRPTVVGNTIWFSPNGHDIWCGVGDNSVEKWRITKRDKLERSPLGSTRIRIRSTELEWPWRSSRGYQVTDDGWILSSDGTRRLLMLPSPWQTDAVRQIWNGKFLAIVYGGLPEPVILDLELEQ